MTHTSRTGVLAGCLRWFIIAGSFAFGSAQGAGHDDIDALRRDIDALKKGQDAMRVNAASTPSKRPTGWLNCLRIRA